MLREQTSIGLDADQQRRARRRCAHSWQAASWCVVDPGQRPVRAGVGVDPGQLPVLGVALREADVRPAPRQPEQVREMLVRAVLPARAPDALELGREFAQRRGGTRRERVRDAVDQRREQPASSRAESERTPSTSTSSSGRVLGPRRPPSGAARLLSIRAAHSSVMLACARCVATPVRPPPSTSARCSSSASSSPRSQPRTSASPSRARCRGSAAYRRRRRLRGEAGEAVRPQVARREPARRPAHLRRRGRQRPPRRARPP